MRACSSSAALPPTVAVLIVSVRSIAKPSRVVAAARTAHDDEDHRSRSRREVGAQATCDLRRRVEQSRVEQHRVDGARIKRER